MEQKQVIRAARRLARQECACGREEYCAVRGMSCSIGNPDGAFKCRYFMESVLPGDAALQTAVMELLNRPIADRQQADRVCERCGAPFIPSNNRQRYCLPCRAVVRREQSRERNWAAYQRKRVESQEQEGRP